MTNTYTVFLSSTFDDLRIHRRKIIDSLVKLQQNIQAMEFWAPSAHDSTELSLKKLRKSKIYVGVLGTRYGTIVENGKSITHLEYEEACKLGIERQVYLIDENKHPITLNNVDTDDKAIKLKGFKQLVSQTSVRGKFISADDLAKQVITNIIDLLKEEGEDIRTAIQEHGILNFNLRTGYSGALTEKNINVSSLISMSDDGIFKFSDSYIESAAAAAVIAKNIKDGNYTFISDFVTFDPEVYRIACFLIKDLGINDNAFADTIIKCEDSTTLRLLISLAGKAKASACIVPICEKTIVTKRYHNDIRSLGLSITPFNDVVRESLSNMEAYKAIPIIEKYYSLAKSQKKWQAKQTFESILKNLKKRE
jgi:Domain of unknown function (DUF4062)